MTRLRARIAERLIQAQSTAAMLTTFNEVDLTAVNEIRARYKDKFEKTHGVKLGFTSFFIKAAIEALRKIPGRQCVDRRQRHRVSRVLRHRRRGLHRSRLDGAGAAQRRGAELRRNREGGRRVRAEGARRLDHARRTDRRHVHDHERRRLRLADVDADPQSAAGRDPRHAQDPGAPDGRRRRDQRSAR